MRLRIICAEEKSWAEVGKKGEEGRCHGGRLLTTKKTKRRGRGKEQDEFLI